MSTSEDTQPIKRVPGRPRKAPVQQAEHRPKHAAPEPIAPDERIGLTVDDPRWAAISFDDGREYRVEDGKIAERVR